MKKYAIIFLFIIKLILSTYCNTQAQTFLNGSFEINTATGDLINASNTTFNSLMSDCYSFGTSGNIDIITSNAYSGWPQDGNWFVMLHGNYTDQLSMKLSAPLTMGSCYTIIFYDRAWSGYTTTGPIEIGLSTTNNSLGTAIYTTPSAPITGIWTERIFSFIAPNNGQYITINETGPTVNFMHVDNFSIISNSPPINLGNDTTLCQGGTLTLDATTSNATYLWQDNSTNPVFNVTQSGTYWVEVTTGCGVVSDTIKVDYFNSTILSLGNDTTLCQGETLTLNATTSNSTYLWQDNSTSPVFNVTQSGTYWVDVTTSCGIVSDTINVAYDASSTLNLGNDTTICSGQVITLSANIPDATYLWQDNSTDSTFNVTQSGIYWVDVTTSCEILSDTLNVFYFSSAALNIGNDTILCTGDVLTLDVTYPNASSYLWQDNSTNPTFNVTQNGTYWVNITTNCGTFSDTLTISYFNTYPLDLGNDTTLCMGDGLIVNATYPAATYLWQDGSITSTFNITQSGIYWVDVSTACGIVSDTIHIDAEDCNCYTYLPNSFSPNKDGINEVFSAVSGCEFSEYNLMVYNRWGMLVFESTDPEKGWNGSIDNINASIGVYNYLFIYKNVQSKEKRKTGYINLIR